MKASETILIRAVERAGRVAEEYAREVSTRETAKRRESPGARKAGTMNEKEIREFPAIRSVRGLVWLVLAVVAVLVLTACATALLGPDDPTYEAECVFYIGVGETVDIYRETFEKCNPVSIIVVTFEPTEEGP